MHLGIHTGLVVAGEMGAGETREEMAIVGETPNVAARLESLAEPGSVLISESTHTLIEGLFVCEALGPQMLKGISKPVGVYRVQEETDARSRFEATASRGLMPMVGREQEIGLLLDRWEQAREGEGQVVLLSGEAGIGKSRIVQMLRDGVAAEDHARLRYQCSPYHTNSALHPIIDQLVRAAGFVRDDSFDTKLDKLQSLLARSSSDPASALPLLAALLSIPPGDRFAPLEISPELQKERTLAALFGEMEDLAASRPLLVIFEDVHWIDPTSQELLDLIVDRTQEIEALVLITHRPVFNAPWGGRPHVTSLTLNRLGRRQSQTMIGALTDNKPLPEEVLGQILARTDGVPLFVEELTKTVLEAGLLKEETNRYVLTGPLQPLAIPATLHDSLIARLDRTSPIKEIAQTAAAIGREFSHELLAGVSSASDEMLVDALAQLAEAELIYRRGMPPRADYTFKHALVRDAAYESLLKGKRHELHGRIARTLEQDFPERAEAEPELLAFHLTAAGLVEQAIPYWRNAGLRAVEHSANVEAVAHFSTGVELFLALPDWSERPQEELALQAPLASALTAAKGYAAPETGNALMRARDLCREVGDTLQMFEVLYGMWNYIYVAGDLHAGLELAEECFELVRHEGKRTRLVAAHCMLGQTNASMGLFDKAQDHFEQSIALYRPEKDRSLGLVYGEDPGILSLGFLTVPLWAKGFPQRSITLSREALDKAEGASHALSIGVTYLWPVVIRCLRREPKQTLEAAETVIAYSSEQTLPFIRGFGMLFGGWALSELGRSEEGIARMNRGLEEWQATGSGFFVPLFLALLAEGYQKCGKIEEALDTLSNAFDVVEHGGENMWTSELLRLRAMCLLSLSSSNAPEAEAAFRDAMEVAKRQNARSLELRAATSLARLWRTQGRTTEARDLVAPVYGWFTEGFDTADLTDAKTLLDELS